jgi:hypothetical protein
MTDSVRDTPRTDGVDSSPTQKEWQPPTLTVLGDARTLTMKGNPAGPLDAGGTAGDTSP